jgi:catechol 2,3-dioxygenase-like lactoylglutathione lyase family enzyme
VIDHLVVATPDLAASARWFESEHGIALSPGGQHMGFGTRNLLSNLGGGTYLEVIGPDPEQPAPSQPRPFGVDDLAAQRLIGWAARVDTMDAAIDAASAVRWSVGPAAAMSRTRPDGVTLNWQLTMPVLIAGLAVRPFLIEWGSEHPTALMPEAGRLRTLRVIGDANLAAHLAVLAVDARVETRVGATPMIEVVIEHGGSVLILRS